MNPNKRRSHLTVLIVSLTLAIAIAVSMIPYWQGYRAYQEGDYQTAYETLHNNRSWMLNPELYCDVVLQYAIELSENKESGVALEIFNNLSEQQLQHNQELYYEIKSRYIIELAENKELDAALEIFNNLTEEQLQLVKTDDILIALAENTVGDVTFADSDFHIVLRNWNTAKKYADKITYTSNNPRLQTFYDRYYFVLGTKALASGNINMSLKYFQQCSGSVITDTYVNILQALQSQEYTTAIHMLMELDQKGISYQYAYGNEEIFQCPWFFWKTTVGKSIDSTKLTLEDQLIIEKANFYFTCKQSETQKNVPSLSNVVLSDRDELDDVSYSDYEKHIISVSQKLSQFYKSCGSAPEGKILILRQKSSKSLSIALNMMQELPYEYFPENLNQVEYVVLLDYSSNRVGSYSSWGSSIPALKEKGIVRVLHMPKQKQLYSSGIIYGKAPPTITSISMFTSSVSGGAPDLTEKICEALKVIDANLKEE